MIESYVKELINSYPQDIQNKFINSPLPIDIIFEGGLFNGSYLAGCLFYLKELEKKNYIQIHKLSGCSIGSIAALLYFINDEDIILNIYQIAYTHFKTNYNVNIFNTVFELIKQHLPKDILKLINKRLYVSYYNIQTGKRIVKHRYKNLDELFEIIRRSCSFPYIIDNQVLYKDKYMDGLYPYLFNANKKTRILYLNIHNLNKIPGMISIKNENTNMFIYIFKNLDDK